MHPVDGLNKWCQGPYIEVEPSETEDYVSSPEELEREELESDADSCWHMYSGKECHVFT